MLKKVAISLITLTVMLGFYGCNSDSESTIETPAASSAVNVTAFSLKSNASILENLDSVYFSIDLNNAEIFNADSLPKGTDISKLLVNISMPSVSKAQLKYRTLHNTDTVIDYSDESTDSINFSNGPVTLSLLALDGQTTLDYKIKVNVHTIKSDTLVWDFNSRRSLPSSIANPTVQKTVRLNDSFVCLVGNGSSYTIATADSPRGNWQISNVTFPFKPQVDELNALGNDLVILSDNGDLYKSSDFGKNWTNCNTRLYHITGCFDGKLLAIEQSGSLYYNVTYPASTRTAVPANFPVKDNSDLIIYSTEWATTPMAITVGGRNAQGSPIFNTWAYDGSQWADITGSHPEAAAGISVFPYYICSTSSDNWTVTKKQILMAVGGVKADGMNSKTVYVSNDLGFNWNPADSLMQLPPEIKAFSNAQIFSYDITYPLSVSKSRADDSWQPMSLRSIPVWARRSSVSSRAIEPITSWNVPTLFMFGGVNDDATLSNYILQGTVTTLMFKPLQ